MTSHAAVFDAWRTASAYADALAVAGASSALWRDRQATRLAELLAFAASHSALYRRRIASSGLPGAAVPPEAALRTLRRIQPVQKPELMLQFDDWVTDPAVSLPAVRAFARDPLQRGKAFLGRYLVWETSGSSGEPALFVQDARSMAVADALEAARGPAALPDAPTPWGGGARTALVGATLGPYASVVAFERVRALNPWLAATSQSFSFLQPMAQLVSQLNHFAPNVLACYPSMAWVLGEEQAAGRLNLALRGVWTGGETLSAAARLRIGQHFDAPVHDSYGASECFLIANECCCSRLHLNADWVVLEPVDRRGKLVAPGELSHHCWLTHLANFVQPIIRYELDDCVRFVPEACDCGSSLPIIEVQGRSAEVLTLRDAKGRAVHLSPLALTTLLEEQAGVFDFQLRQQGPRSLCVDLQARDVSQPMARRADQVLRGFLRERGLESTQVEVHCHSRAAVRGRSGKRCRIVAGAALPLQRRMAQ